MTHLWLTQPFHGITVHILKFLTYLLSSMIDSFIFNHLFSRNSGGFFRHQQMISRWRTKLTDNKEKERILQNTIKSPKINSGKRKKKVTYQLILSHSPPKESCILERREMESGNGLVAESYQLLTSLGFTVDILPHLDSNWWSDS